MRLQFFLFVRLFRTENNVGRFEETAALARSDVAALFPATESRQDRAYSSAD